MSEPNATAATAKQAAEADQSWVELALELATRAGLLLGTLLLGWILARVARRLITGLVDRVGLEVLAEKVGASRLLYRLGIKEGVARLSGRLAYWAVMLATLFLALDQLGLPGLTDGLAQLVAYTPRLAAGAALALGGFWAADHLKGLVAPSTIELTSTRRFAGALSYWSVAVLATTLALQQIGVEVTLIHGLIELLYGVLALCAALAFALSARQSVARLIAGHYARKLLRPGDALTLEDATEGTLTSLGATHACVALDNARELLIPYDELMSTPFQVVYGDA